MKNKNLILLIFFGFLLVFLSRWKLFLTDGIIGHNWDWNVAFLKDQNLLAVKSGFFAWVENSFGKQTFPQIYYFFTHFLGSLFGGEVQTKALLFFVPFFSFLNSLILFSFLTKKFLGKKDLIGAFAGGIVYAFSPSVFNDFIGGQLISLVGYAFFPLYFYFYFKCFEEKNFWVYLFPLIFIFSILSGSHDWILALGVSFMITIFFYRKKLLRFILILAVLFLSISHILTNMVPGIFKIYEIMPESLIDPLSFRRGFINHLQTIDKVFLGAGYGDRNLFLRFLGNYKPFFYIFSYLFSVVILGNLLLRTKQIKEKKLFIWGLLMYLSGLFFTTAGRDPLGGFFLFLMEKIIFLRAFRTFFHFFVLPNFFFAILVMISFSLLKKRKIIAIFLIILFLFARLPMFIEGDNGRRILKKLKKDSLDIYKINPEYLEIIKSQFAESKWYRTLYVPTAYSPVYKETSYQKMGQGGDAEMIYSSKPILLDFFQKGERQKFYDFLEKNIIGTEPFDQQIFGFLSFKKVIRRRDIIASFSKLASQYDDKIIDEKLSDLEAISKSEYIDYYNLNNDYFIPHFYVPKQKIYWKGETKDLVEILDLKDYQLKSEILLDTELEGDSLTRQIDKSEEKEIFITSFPVDLIKNEELGTYQSPKMLEPLEAKIPPGSLLYSLSAKKEELDLKNRRTPSSVLDYTLLLSDKRISEFLVFGSSKSGSFNLFLSGYSKVMDSALEILEEMKANNDKLFLENLVRFQRYLRAGKTRLEGYSYGGGVKERIEELFKNYDLKLKKLIPMHDFSKNVYQLSLPKEGEYEIFVKDEEKLASASSLFENSNWRLLETKYFGKGENEYILNNLSFGENLVTDSFKINDFTGNTVYRVSLRYRSDSGSSLFSVNQSQEGKLFDYYLPKTGSNFEDFEMFFRSSEDAQRAFITLSVPQYENLKIEKIRQPEILLRRIDTGGQGTETTPKITFAKVNSTKYRILVEGAKEPYSIVFSESFHKGWKVYVNIVHSSVFNVQSKYGETVASYFDGEVKEGTPRMNFLEPATFETWDQKPLPEERHYLVNGYANAWRILPADAGNLENYELIVEFEPQRLYYIGLFVSFATLGTCFVIMIVSIVRKKKYEVGDGLTD